MESFDELPAHRVHRSQSLLENIIIENPNSNSESLVRRNHTISTGFNNSRNRGTTKLENNLISVEGNLNLQNGESKEKNSSFVVVRSGKGGEELMARNSNLNSYFTSPTLSGSPPSQLNQFSDESVSRPVLESRNSLAFLEAEENKEEDWERSILDARAMENSNRDQFSTRRPSATSSTSFQGQPNPFTKSGSNLNHSRSQTERHTFDSTNSWNGTQDEISALRRRQSLNFRIQEPSSQDSKAAERWHEKVNNEESLLVGLSLSSSFSRTRAGTGPPGLTLSIQPNNLHRSSSPHSLNSLHGNLSHSNSLNSHHSLGGGALSPVGVYPRSPWSPTVEEAKELGMGNGVPGTSLTRGESGSSRGSGSGSGGRIGIRLGEQKDSDEVDSPVSVESGEAVGEGNGGGNNSVGNNGNRAELRRSLTGKATTATTNRRLPPLMTNSEILASLATPTTAVNPATDSELVQSFLSRQGPASASAFVPPIGHSHLPPTAANHNNHLYSSAGNSMPSIPEPRNFTAGPGMNANDWTRQKESLIGNTPTATPYQSTPIVSSSLPNNSNGFPSINGTGTNQAGGESWPSSGGFGVGLAIRQQEQIQILQNQMHLAMQQLALNNQSSLPIVGSTGLPLPANNNNNGYGAGGMGGLERERESGEGEGKEGVLPIDIQELIATKGYNPTSFNLMPPGARFFVIKSYTEEDVHKSLKHEIWASTDLGNKRLDRAFRESGDKGPIYLFFSVNASGHFAGMAQMLTSVDYATSSNVWASDKWKGVLKVRWIYIKDVPLASLRHIRLSNTPENKPVTSSRDTQEVPYDAGCEVLRILSTYQSRTSLLQDFAYYEAGAIAPTQAHYQPTPNRHSTPPQHSHLPPGGNYSQGYSQAQQLHHHQQQQQYYGYPPPAPPPPQQGMEGRMYFGNGNEGFNGNQIYHQQAF